MSTFEIVTIFNDPAQYAAAAASFAAAGFTPDRARFTPLDNSAGNHHDPYTVLARIAADAVGREPYVIFCHQDVRLDRGDGYDQLRALIDRVAAADPDWAVLGNAGTNYRRLSRWWVDDPNGRYRSCPVPEAVMSLDENFLVFQRRHAPAPTPGLDGFHLYATDAVLNAARAGRRSYVVPFLLHHLSGGSADSPAFRDACRRFEQAWNPRVCLGYVTTTCAYLVMARSAPMNWLLHRWRARHTLAWFGVTFAANWWNCLGLGRATSLRLRRRLG